MSDRWQPERVPTSDAELFDYLRWRFGIGYWDEDDPRFPPYFKFRMNQISMIKATRNKRRVSFAELHMAGEYCHRHQIPVTKHTDLYRQIGPARKEAMVLAVTDIQKRLDQAIAYERTLADEKSPIWIGRLNRARGPYREEVLAEWTAMRNPQSEQRQMSS